MYIADDDSQDLSTRVGERLRLACDGATSGNLAMATDIALRLLRLSPDAVHAFAAVLERFELGQQRYGAPDLEGRDWVRELEEEVLDQHAYIGLLLVARRRRELAGTK